MYTWGMRANSVGKKSAEVEQAYVAGLIDGDGAIMATIEPHQEKQFRFRIRVTLKVTQKKKQDVAFLPTLMGAGVIRKNRTTYDWIVRSQHDALCVLHAIMPHMRIKKRQATLAIAILTTPIVSKQSLIAVARSADALSRLNVRSNNRRKNHVSMIQAFFSSND
jgi:hypothetical protein